MKPITRRLIRLIVLNVGSAALLSVPLVGLVVSASKKNWLVALACLAVFFVFGKMLYAWENRWGIRSPGNPNAAEGIGVTFIAPWVRRKKSTCQDCHLKRHKNREKK